MIPSHLSNAYRKKLERKPLTLRVAVVGSGPAGSSAAETLAKAGIETYLFERKLDNAKPCGGAIPLCMVSEFDLPPKSLTARCRKMKMISPSNVEVDININKEDEYIGMCRREVLDGFMRDRAAKLGAKLINGTVHKLDIPDKQHRSLHHPLRRSLRWQRRRDNENPESWMW